MVMIDDRPQLASLNGELIVPENAAIGALSSAAFYGRGVFTTARIIDGAPWLWDRHWERLSSNAEAIGMNIARWAEADVRGALDRLIAANGVTDGKVRVTFFDSAASPIWSETRSASVDLLIITAKLRPVPSPFKITLSPYRVNTASPLAGIKSCNYLANILSIEEARARGFHEAIQLNEKAKVAGGCMSNIFWRQGHELFTPKLETGCLGGTTRGFVLENLQVEEVATGLEALQTADEIFLTSAGIGIVAAESFDRRKLDAGPHPITELMSQLGDYQQSLK